MAGLPKVLLSGFEPFNGELLNPSQEVLAELSGERIAGHRVEPLLLPVDFEAAPAALLAAIERHRPELVLCTGEAGGCTGLRLERVALNFIDARIADGAGRQPREIDVLAGAPAAYLCRLPLAEMAEALRDHGVPAELSLTAGSYVCNAVYFRLLHALAGTGTRGGFIHLPYLPEQACRHPGAASLSLATQAKGLGIALGVALGQ
ncbi:MAG: pyroglutamyl-peptidase I [Aquimonas sp.]|nr:pyroglutamyl-peptidase I [Aquimonas sp.]